MTSRFSAVVAFMVLLLWGSTAMAVEILSLRPATVSPGDRLTIAYTPPDAPVSLKLGEQSVTAEEAAPGTASFRVPLMPAGTYVVQIVSDGDTVVTPFQVNVLEPVPQIASLSPENIPECAESIEKQVVVTGRNFFPESRLMVDGSLVAAKVLDPQHISFDASALSAGVHGVQAVNPSGTRSLPFSLYVNSVPTISDVSVGDNYTNYYELVIRGENFFQQSSLLVNEAPPGLIGTRPRQYVVWGKGRPLPANAALDPDQGEYLYYRDCHTLVYYRFPVSGQERDLALKVINPDGKASRPYHLMAN